MRRRVVITGMGAVTPLASDLPGTWQALCEGRSGIREIDGAHNAVRIAGQAVDFDPNTALGTRTARQFDRYTQLALVAAREARAVAGLPGRSGDERWATVIGTGLGGIGSHERAVLALAAGRRSGSAYTAVAMVPSAAAAAVAIESGAQGPALAPGTACASGTDAIGLGADLIRLGRADVVLAGGADAPVGPVALSAFNAVGAAATGDGDPASACRPFAVDRTGLVVAEGAAVVVLESAEHAAGRGATALAEVLGYGSSNDAHHLSAPAADGVAATRALRAALRDAQVSPEQVGYVNAHGTGTVLNDRVEARVLAGVLGARTPVSSTKSMTGHLMGACGALEAAVCVQVLRTGIVPATRNCHELDPECAGIDVVRGDNRAMDVSVAVSPSFGFGGYNAVLTLGRA
ncbi:3-oxoacyl-[acyl-carrier-protein] synthase II [Micromonospora nigra]|uniref:3-oxoacyl-[acyl-carrier-protein] synthase II n=1 Tax=Micromonospora nigra TaxID=145857 RepID=A0A1C6RCZ8_9ACTN|nr:beta-ketoacyl-[acyl-carrier-protein] synthase family protein [Micromonospora nigra]SCL15026.1 3-oxoacyl-[acyl-carrier-protein] synthase II [Micromonospora nigra]